MGQIRANRRKGVPGSYEDTGKVGRGRKAPLRVHRRKGCERKKEKRAECEEKLDIVYTLGGILDYDTDKIVTC